jgi:hypothetical protein
MRKIILHFKLFILPFFLIMLFLHLSSQKIIAQILPIEDLFSYNSIFNDRYIRISDRIKDELKTNKNFVRNTYYNVNKDIRWKSDTYPSTVRSIYVGNKGENKVIELLDDGQHLDNEKNDGVYSNYLATDTFEYNTDEFEIDVCCMNNTISINYTTVVIPLVYAPTPAQIQMPANNKIVATTRPIIRYSIDPNADGSNAILLERDIPFGQKLEGIIWEKQHKKTNMPILQDTINISLSQNKKYSLIVWSYVNAKMIDGKWQNSAYSIEKSSFTVDTTMNAIVDTIITETLRFTLFQNYPNPFYEETIISWMQQKDEHVSATLYDILGRTVKKLIDNQMYSGLNFTIWDGKDDNGCRATQGIYFLSVAVQDERKVIKIVYLKR